ncbi:MAG TPA: PIN domain nuclease [Acidimicrobiales bacterium]|nr:PIN domain nuclease [Acidimicrobiales bacterium]
MILVDTSAWIEFLRDTGSPECDEVERLLDGQVAITDPIMMEVLAGARDEHHLHQLRGLMGRARMEHCTPADFAEAALLYRTCRARGETVRRLFDCLIAAVAIRRSWRVLHHDADFDTLARHTALEIHGTA